MSTTANIGYGAAFSTSPDGTTYTRLAQVVDIDWSPKVDSIDVSNQDSPAVASTGAKNAWREKIPGMADAGQITWNIVFIKSSLTTLNAFMGVVFYVKIVFADAGATTLVVKGFITDLKKGAPLEDKETMDVTMELTGAPTIS